MNLPLNQQIKRLGIFLLFVAMLCGPMPAALADDEGNDGNIEFETGRIGQEDRSPDDGKETELEKTAPGLFSEQTRKAIEAKKAADKKAEEELKSRLLSMPYVKDKSDEKLKARLFSKEYTVDHSASQDEREQSQEDEGISLPMLIVLLVSAFILVGGIFAVMRKTLGGKE